MQLGNGKEFAQGRPLTEQERGALNARLTQDGVFQDCSRLQAYRDALDRVAIVAATDLTGRITEVNDPFCEISGYSRDELIGAYHSLLRSGHHPAGFYGDLWRTIKSGSVWRGDICNRTKSGDIYWVDTTIAPLRGPDGAPAGYVSIRFDISDRKATESKLIDELNRRQAMEALLTDLIEAIPAGVATFDPQDKLLFNNSTFRELCHSSSTRSDHATGGRGMPGLLPMPDGDAELAKLWPQMRWADSNATSEPFARQVRPDQWIQIHNRRSASGNLVSIQTDISELKRAEQLIKDQAERDVLTGLANRHALRQHLDKLSTPMGADGPSWMLMLLDLDHFKLINDRFGHDGGDVLLRTIAERLVQSVRRSDMVARLGGDEFAVLLRENVDRKTGSRIAQELLEVIQRPVQIGQQTVIPSGSLGISCFPQDGKTPQELYKNADLALYQAKLAGRNRHCAYNRTMRKERQRRLKLIEALRVALNLKEIDVALQPQCHAQTGEHAGFEALVRWRLGGREVAPIELISIAEEAGLVSELGFQVIDKGLQAVAALRAEGLSPGSIAFNIASAQLLKPDFADRLKQLVLVHGLPASNIEIEVTENVILDRASGDIAAVLHVLRDAGMSVSLDDFGTGYASLKHLKQFPINRLKIDRSFIEGILKKKDDEIIVRTIISLAHSLGFDVVAEGVETQQQYDLLHAYGCDLVQGYLLARPMPISKLRTYLTSARQGPVIAGATTKPRAATTESFGPPIIKSKKPKKSIFSK